MFIFDEICRLSIGRAVRILDLQVNRPVFWLRLVSVPSEPAPAVGLPPLDPVVGPLPFEVKFDPKTRSRSRVLAFEKRDGIDLSDNFVGISSGRFVPDGGTATGARETVVDASEEL
jgi:hypothetical protein